MNKKQISYPINDRWSILWLLVATVLGIFSVGIGRWLIPVTAWLSAIFYIRFFRTQRRAWLAYLLTSISIIIITAITTPSWMASSITSIIIGVTLLGPLPLFLDRWLAPRLPGFASTLVFPLAWTALDFINANTNPMPISTSPYALYSDLVLLQLISLTGIWGLSFLSAWLGSIVNWAWEREFAWHEIKRGALIYIGLMLLVVAYGQARLWFAPTPAQTVRVAGFTMVDWRVNQPAMTRTFTTDMEAFRQMMEERYQLYFDATIKEARAGAKMISWPENAMTVALEDEPALLARLAELAKQEGIYLAAPIVEMSVDSPYANKLIIFDPQGQIVLEHYKYGGAEPDRITGDGILHTVQTPFGVISGIICWDIEFQGTVTQAGRNDTDILFTPNMTFRETDPIFAYIAVMRAIENGVSVVHISDGGLSVAVDPFGRMLATMDHYPKGERALVAQVPTKGVWTLYPIIGDLFGWLAVVGTVALVIWGVVQSLLSRKAKAASPESQSQVGQAI